MQYLPASFTKVLSSLQQKNNDQIPHYTNEATGSQSTLFDELSESEKQQALYKLQQLASEQPSSTTPKPRRRCFNWKIFAMVFSLISLATLAIVGLVYAVDKDVDPGLAQKLKTTQTNLDRFKLLPKNSDWFFDFTKQDKYTFQPGGVVNANAATFPATIGQGMALAMLNLGPCSMLPPHLHPRATNYVVAIHGTTQTIMINENGAPTITEILTPGQMTIFPQGSVHTMMNMGCENAQLISALNSEDQGTTNLANAFFSLPQNFTNPIVGANVNYQQIDGHIPPVGTGSNYGPEQCIAACKAKGKLVRRDF